MTLQGGIQLKAIVVTDEAAGTAGMTLAERPEPKAAANDVVVQVNRRELTRGVNYDRDTQRYLTLERSHIVFLLVYEGRRYLLDTGFGAYLPLTPVPLIGETVDGPLYRELLRSRFGLQP